MVDETNNQRTLLDFSLLVDYSTKRAVSDTKSTKNFSIWSPKQRRAYHRIMSGYKMAQFSKQRLRFMTLTTSNEGRDNDIKRDFNVLVKRIRRHYGRFEYIRVRTSEGNGVLHVLYRGTFIPRSWLKKQWSDIHASWLVDIRDTQRYHCSYIINQYLCSQSSFVRYSCTTQWIFRGAVKQWTALKKSFWVNGATGIAYENRKPVNFIERWNDILYAYARSRFEQTSLFVGDYRCFSVFG